MLVGIEDLVGRGIAGLSLILLFREPINVFECLRIDIPGHRLLPSLQHIGERGEIFEMNLVANLVDPLLFGQTLELSRIISNIVTGCLPPIFLFDFCSNEIWLIAV